MIYRARVVVTMNGSAIENGAVVVAGNRIAEVGTFAEVRAHHGGEVVDLGERAILPGLINDHCHLDYTMLRGAIVPQQSFADWIRHINALKSTLTDEDYLAAITSGLADARRWGTTSIANIESFPALLTRLPASPLRTWWFSEMIDLSSRNSAEQFVAETEARFAKTPQAFGGYGFSPHAPYTASAELYQQVSARSRATGMLVSTHIAESSEEREMFEHARGSLFDLLARLGRPMDDCGSETSLSGFLRAAQPDERWIVAHLNELTESDFAQLARMPRKFSIVHCPRSHAYFGHTPFAFERLRELGFNIAIGTDSLASNRDLNLFAEMRVFAEHHPALDPGEILALATTNAAAALGQQNALGRIRTGFLADMIAVPFAGKTADIFEKIVGHEHPIEWVLVDGLLR